MPDRYGDGDEPPVVFDHLPAEGPAVVDFDSRRRAREVEEAARRARAQRERLADTMAARAPLDRHQAARASQHRRQVTDQAEKQRKAMRILNCQLCDGEGYVPGTATVCDHVDRRSARARGMDTVRAIMGWDKPTDDHSRPTTQAPGASKPRPRLPDLNPLPMPSDEPPWPTEPPPEEEGY